MKTRMGHKLLAVLLSLVLLVGLLPSAALGALRTVPEAAGALELAFLDFTGWVDAEDGGYDSYSLPNDPNWQEDLYMVPGDDRAVVFRIKDGDQITEGLDVRGDSITLTPLTEGTNAGQGFFSLKMTSYGEAAIRADVDGTAYSLSIYPTMPVIGFYTGSQATPEGILINNNEQGFNRTDDVDTVYLCPDEQSAIRSVTFIPRDESQEGMITTRLNENGSAWDITVSADAPDEDWYELRVTFIDYHGGEPEGRVVENDARMLHVFNRTTRLQFTYLDWDWQTDGWTVREDEDAWESEMWNSPGGDEMAVAFRLSTSEELIRDSSDLRTSRGITLTPMEAPYGEKGYFYMALSAFGEETVTYSGTQDYTMNVHSVHPSFAAYSEPSATDETYLPFFTYSDACNEFYVGTYYGEEFSVRDIVFDRNYDFATIERDESSPDFWRVSILSNFPDEEYVGFCVSGVEMRNGDSHEFDDWRFSVRVVNGVVRLQVTYAWTDWVNDPNEEHGGYDEYRVSNESNWESRYYCPPGYTNVVAFRLSDSEEIITDPNAIYFTGNGTLIPVEDGHNDGRGFFKFTLDDFGQGDIWYDSGSLLYNMTVKGELPRIGAYSEKRVSEETYLFGDEFYRTPEQTTFYVGLSDSEQFTILDARLNNGWQDQSGYITLGAVEDNFLPVEIGEYSPLEFMIELEIKLKDANAPEEEEGEWEYCQFRCTNLTPRLVWTQGYVDYDPQTQIETYGYDNQSMWESVYNGVPGHDELVVFKMSNGAGDLIFGGLSTVGDVTLVPVENQPGFYRVNLTSFAGGTIRLTSDDETFDIECTARLPEIGMYTAPSATEENFIIGTFDITSEQNYFFICSTLPETDTITDVAFEDPEWAEQFAVIESYADQVWKVTFNSQTPSPTGVPFEAKILHDDEDDTYEYQDLLWQDVRNKLPRLLARYVWWNDETSEWVVDLMDYWDDELYAAPGVDNPLAFRAIPGDELVVDAARLSGNGVTFIQDPEDERIFYTTIESFGEHTITYTAENGDTYSMKAIGSMPHWAAFSSTTPVEETYITEFTASNGSKTFYVAAPELTPEDAAAFNWTLVLDNEQELGDAITVNALEDRPNNVYWSVTVNDNAPEYFEVFATVRPVADDPDWGWSFCVRVHNTAAHLELTYTDWIDGECVLPAEPYWETSMNGAPRLEMTFALRLAPGTDYITDLTKLSCSGGTITQNYEDKRILTAVFEDFGSYAIRYTGADQTTYSLPVTMGIPPAAAYSAMEISEQTYITEFTATEENPTFYLGLRDVEHRDGVYYALGLESTQHYLLDYLTIAPVEDDSVPAKFWSVTVKEGAPEAFTLDFVIWGREDGNDEPFFFFPIVVNVTVEADRPALQIAMADGGTTMEELLASPTIPWADSAELAPRAAFEAVFRLGENSEFITDASSLKGKGVKITQSKTDSRVYTLEMQNFGQATVTWTDGQGHQSTLTLNGVLPGVAAYATPKATEQMYMTVFQTTAQIRDFYIGTGDVEDGFTYSLAVDPEQAGYVTIAPYDTADGRFWKITVKDSAPETMTLRFTATVTAGTDSRTWTVNVKVLPHVPGDMDGSGGKPNNRDAIILFRAVSGLMPSFVQEYFLDVNGDSKRNNKDALLLFRFVSGLPVELVQ